MGILDFVTDPLEDFFNNLTGQTQAGTAASAAGAQQAGIQQSIDFQREILGQTRADLAAAVDAGLIDIQDAFDIAGQELQPFADPFAFEQAKGILQDPSQVLQAPGAQFEREEGLRALQNAFSRTTGGGLSSDVTREAQRFGSGFAATQIDRQLARLNPFINLAAGTAGNLANLAQARGTQATNLRLGGASGAGNFAAQISPAIAQNISSLGFAEGSGQIGEQNARTDALNRLLGLGAQFLVS